MNQLDSPSEIIQAELQVARNLDNFENAMQRLESRIYQSHETFQKTVNKAKKPFLTAISYGSRAGQSVALKASQNPKPLFFGAMILLGAVSILSFIRRRSTLN